MAQGFFVVYKVSFRVYGSDSFHNMVEVSSDENAMVLGANYFRDIIRSTKYSYLFVFPAEDVNLVMLHDRENIKETYVEFVVDEVLSFVFF